MIFPQADAILPHPSQISEFLLEGVLLFVLLQLHDRTHPPAGTLSGAFLLGYGIVRFTAEHFREPDSFLGVLGPGLSMGQWLCKPMSLAVGVEHPPSTYEPVVPAAA